MRMNVDQLEILIYITAIVANLLMIILFYFRINQKPKMEYYIGIFFQLLVVPMAFILYELIIKEYPLWMIIYSIIFLFFLMIELLLDYILHIEFRSNKKIVIPYIILYILSFWGLLGMVFAQDLVFGLIVFVLYAIHTGFMIQAHKKN